VIGDVLVAIDGKPVSDIGGVQSFLGGERVGKTLTALFIRGGVLTELAITLGEQLGGEK